MSHRVASHDALLCVSYRSAAKVSRTCIPDAVGLGASSNVTMVLVICEATCTPKLKTPQTLISQSTEGNMTNVTGKER